jgi:protoporphyrinogen oxidase
MVTEGSSEERIAILGAGISGLSLGWLLSRIGKRVTIFESTNRIGGLARTFDWHGVPCDIAPHRLYTKDKGLIALIESLVPLREHRRNSRILMKDKVIQDPINPIELVMRFDPQTGARLVWGFVARPKLPEDSFEALALNRYGRGLYDFFFEPYTKKMFGVPPSQISVAWGREKLRSSGLLDAIRRSSKTFFSTFYYPAEGGYGRISDAMLERIQGEVKLESKVTGIERSESRVRAVDYEQNGSTHRFECDRVFSTLPATLLGRMFGEDIRLRFRGIQLVYLHVKRPRVMPYQWVYFGDGDVVINRMAEFRNFHDPEAESINTVLCAEVTAETDRPVDDVLDALERYQLVKREDIDDTLVLPEGFGYPVYDRGFEVAKDQAGEIFGRFENLHLVGRNAEFRHIEVDEDLESALAMVRRVYPNARLDA